MDYHELVQLAHLCARNAYAAGTDEVAQALGKWQRNIKPKRRRSESLRISASRRAEYGEAAAAKPMTRDEAQRIAVNIAKLPDLLSPTPKTLL
jgi:hypothetical protein